MGYGWQDLVLNVAEWPVHAQIGEVFCERTYWICRESGQLDTLCLQVIILQGKSSNLSCANRLQRAFWNKNRP